MSAKPEGVKSADPATSAELDEEESYRSPGLVPLDGRGSWWGEFREDLARYAAHHDGRWLTSLCIEQGLWALLEFRIASAIYRREDLGVFRKPVLAVLVLCQKVVETTLGMALSFQADLAPGLYIGHFGPTLVHYDVSIGTGCNLSPGVAIGMSGRGEHRGVPTIGRRVYIGTNAVVVGKIHIGDGAVIGANTLVTRDVPAGCTVVGSPAQLVSRHGTAGMGLHQRPVPGPPRARRLPRRRPKPPAG